VTPRYARVRLFIILDSTRLDSTTSSSVYVANEMNIPDLNLERGGDAGDDRKRLAATRNQDDANAKEKNRSRLIPFGTDLWYVDGPDVDFFSFPYPTRMVVVRLTSSWRGSAGGESRVNDGGDDDANNSPITADGGGSWIWSPIPVTDDLAREIEDTAGTPRHIVSPNKLHWLFLREWSERYPRAKLHAGPGLLARVEGGGCGGSVAAQLEGVRFDDVALESLRPDPGYARDVDQILFRTIWFEEVVFFHRPSGTVIFADLVQRFPYSRLKGWKGWLMNLDGMAGTAGGAPGELRFLVWANGDLPQWRRALNHILYEWQPRRLVVAHGDNASELATEIVAHSFRWVPEHPRPCACGCIPTAVTTKVAGDDDRNGTQKKFSDDEQVTKPHG